MSSSHFVAGNQFAASGEYAAALREFQAALALEPGVVEAASNAGAALMALGRPAEAVAYFRHAIAVRPAFADAHANLGGALAAIGRFDEARTHLARAVELDPAQTQAAQSLGLLALQAGDLETAVAVLRTAASRNPADAQTLYHLGHVLHASGAHAQALETLQRAIALAPSHARALESAQALLRELGRFGEAEPYAARAVELEPQNPRLRIAHGLVLSALGRETDALHAFERAVALAPELPDAHYNLGVQHLYMGQSALAQGAFERALELDPAHVRAYDGWFNTRKADASDAARFSSLEVLAQREDMLPPADRIQLHYTMAKVLEDFGRYGEAFDHLLSGSRLKRASLVYDEAGELDLMERISRCFTSERMEELRGAGNPSRAPIFVLGMPRSGTTLVEQIIASHPQVRALGERTDFADELIATGDRLGEPYPEFIARMDRDALGAIGTGYLTRIGPIDTPRVTDKMPANFLCAGMIALSLPHAKIVHVRRDPVDTCLSCFAQLFSFGNPHTYDLAELGRYYRAYERLMEHWRSVLPAGVMIEVQYEDVVADLETQARAIIAHCGLAWDDRCLSFHRTKRAVTTASMTQVRQPLYSASVGRHRRYGDRLQPLLDALAGRAR